MKLSVFTTLFAAFAFTAGVAHAADPASSKNPIVEIKTSLGPIKAEIFADKSPISAKNFMEYVDAKFYDGTIFHRVIPTFMVQGGGYDQKYERKPTRPALQNEADNGLKNTRGTVAMARTNDPHSATAQFFVNTVDNKFLDHQGKDAQGWGYAVFGKVTEGMDVVDKIKDVKTGANGPFAKDAPNELVVIQSVRRR
jgi:peptidyl-prolyl cis-trans isomerase B (cyclophilin B)